jgi:glycerate 2-kinase
MPHHRATDGKPLARRIFLRTLEALNPGAAVERVLAVSDGVLSCAGRAYDLRRYPDLRVLAVGKAAHGMLQGLVSLLPGHPFRGLVSAPTEAQVRHPGCEYLQAGHPEPDGQSLLAGEAALSLLRGATEETLALVLLSGGGSAMMERPLASGIGLEDLRRLHRALVSCGANIEEINTVRKHVSAVKGGRLAQAAVPAPSITLAVSDVPAGKESALASGPTLPDPTTSSEALEVLSRYRLKDRIPPALLAWMEGEMPETPKAGDPAFRKAQFELVLGLHELFHSAHRVAESEDCLAYCDNTSDDWPVGKAADFLLAELERLQAKHPRQAVALIADGELSSAVTGDGLGGRNSAFVLDCARKIAGKGIVVLSAGTDGQDGNSPAAGAVADGETLGRAERAGLDARDFFQRSDSFRFFEALGDTVVTGPTGTNLRDLRLLLRLPPGD